MWEHAYFEQHGGEATTSYIDNFWLAIDWGKVSENFEAHNLQGKVAPII
jgi:superoxide dismutase